MGALAGSTGLYTAIVTILVESCAPYAVAYMLTIGFFAAGSNYTAVFSPSTGVIQVRDVLAFFWRVAVSEYCNLNADETGYCPVLHNSAGRGPESADQ
jgi:hypothetical protein